MEGAEEELERRSKFLKSLIQQKRKSIEQQEQHDHLHNNNVKIRACDMPLPLQNHAFRRARELMDSMPPKKLNSKLLALTLKKVRFLYLIFLAKAYLFSLFLC